MHFHAPPARIPYPDQQALPLRTSPAVAHATTNTWSEMLGLLRFPGITPTPRPRTRRATFAAPGANVYLGFRWLILNPSGG